MTVDLNVRVSPTTEGHGIGDPTIGKPRLDLGDDIELARLREVVGQPHECWDFPNEDDDETKKKLLRI
uniref:Uncharacterized protein n=1 Tax=Cannabis sativa TaxID=3483 RepID=A0A803P1P7_CANSA